MVPILKVVPEAESSLPVSVVSALLPQAARPRTMAAAMTRLSNFFFIVRFSF